MNELSLYDFAALYEKYRDYPTGEIVVTPFEFYKIMRSTEQILGKVVEPVPYGSWPMILGRRLICRAI